MMRRNDQCALRTAETDQEASCIAALEQEMQGMQQERARVTKLRSQLEQAASRMEQDQSAWAKHKASVVVYIALTA